MIVSNWLFDTTKAQYAIHSVSVPDTSRESDMDKISWEASTAGGGVGLASEDMSFLTAPFEEHGWGYRSELSEAAVSTFSGDRALHTLHKYGKVGLYQQILWSNTVELLAGLSLGPRA